MAQHCLEDRQQGEKKRVAMTIAALAMPSELISANTKGPYHSFIFLKRTRRVSLDPPMQHMQVYQIQPNTREERTCMGALSSARRSTPAMPPLKRLLLYCDTMIDRSESVYAASR